MYAEFVDVSSVCFTSKWFNSSTTSTFRMTIPTRNILMRRCSNPIISQAIQNVRKSYSIAFFECKQRTENMYKIYTSTGDTCIRGGFFDKSTAFIRTKSYNTGYSVTYTIRSNHKFITCYVCVWCVCLIITVLLCFDNNNLFVNATTKFDINVTIIIITSIMKVNRELKHCNCVYIGRLCIYTHTHIYILYSNVIR